MNKEVAYYSVCDSVAGQFGPLFPAINDGVAKRMFRRLLSDVDKLDDYELWQVGTFDQDSGDFTPADHFVCDGVEAMEANK